MGIIVIAGSPAKISYNSESGYDSIIISLGGLFPGSISPTPCSIPATPNITPTVDPTLAAQFNLGDTLSTPLPTFTAAAPVVQPTLEPIQSLNGTGFPPILAILVLTVLGLFGIVISILRGSSTGL